MELTAPEARVIGALAEKEATTPQHYPLTLNALVAACNQTSNRDPVVEYDDATVERALTSLREKGLARIVHSRGNRAARYRHVLDEAATLDRGELALVAVLLLRGPQTVGELRARTERMATFDDLGDVERVLDGLAARPVPLVARLARRPGQKEARYAQLLGGPPPEDVAAPEAAVPPAPSVGGTDRLAALEAEVARLRDELHEVRVAVDDLRSRSY